MKTIQYDLHLLKKDRGGVGRQRFSDAVNIDKPAELLRAYKRTDEVAEAANSVLETALRYQATHQQQSRKMAILPSKSKSEYLLSTLE